MPTVTASQNVSELLQSNVQARVEYTSGVFLNLLNNISYLLGILDSQAFSQCDVSEGGSFCSQYIPVVDGYVMLRGSGLGTATASISSIGFANQNEAWEVSANCTWSKKNGFSGVLTDFESLLNFADGRYLIEVEGRFDIKGAEWPVMNKMSLTTPDGITWTEVSTGNLYGDRSKIVVVDSLVDKYGHSISIAASTTRSYPPSMGELLVDPKHFSAADEFLIEDQDYIWRAYAGNDKLFGGAGAQWLEGDDGNDTLSGGEGDDTLIGGAGSDVYEVDSAGDLLVETLAAAKTGGVDLVRASVSFTLAENIENLVLVSDQAIDGTGNALANRLTGNAQANLLDGAGGIDTLTGGRGGDIYVVDHAKDLIVEGIGGDDDIDGVIASVSWTLGANLEHLLLADFAGDLVGVGNSQANAIYGNESNNRLLGAAGNDLLSGGDGNDTLEGGEGRDTLVGGMGDDTYVLGIDIPGPAVALQISASMSEILGREVARDTPDVGQWGPQSEYAVFGITQSSLLLRTLSGDVEIRTPEGYGFAGAGGVDADRYFGFMAVGKAGASDTYWVEHDIVTGLQQKVKLPAAVKGASSRSASSALSEDGRYLVLAVDDEKLSPGQPLGERVRLKTNVYVVDLQTGAQKLLTPTAKSLGANAEISALRISADGRYIGFSSSASNLVASDLNQQQDDFIAMNPLFEAHSLDQIHDDGGNDTVNSTVSYTLGDGLENLLLVGKGALNGAGNDGYNHIVGNAAANLLQGGGGQDTLEGGAGNDTLSGFGVLVGGLGDDLYLLSGGEIAILELAGGGVDEICATGDIELADLTEVEHARLQAAWSYPGQRVSGNLRDNRLQGNAADNLLEGRQGNDTLLGGVGRDTLVGGAGKDVLDGGRGDDYYLVEDALDTVRESGDTSDLDTVGSFINYTLGAGIERLELLGDNPLAGTGGDGDDELVGNQASNVLNGKAGQDTLRGGGGDDVYVIDSNGVLAAAPVSVATQELADAVNAGIAPPQERYRLEMRESNVVVPGGAVWTVLLPTLIDGDAGTALQVPLPKNLLPVQLSAKLDASGRFVSLSGFVAQGPGGMGIMSGDAYLYEIASRKTRKIPSADGQNVVVHAVTPDGRYAIFSKTPMPFDGAGESAYVLDLATGKQKQLDISISGLPVEGNSYPIAISDDGLHILIQSDAAELFSGGGASGATTGYVQNPLHPQFQMPLLPLDLVRENEGEGIDTVLSAVSYTLGDNLERLELGAKTQASQGEGNGLDNWLAGNERANYLVGLDGNDSLLGGAGSDTLQGGAGDDVLEGGDGVDLLEGGEGNDTLDGGLGIDTLVGGYGDDLYRLDSASELGLLQEGEAAGLDTLELGYSVKAVTTVSLSGNLANIETLIAKGAGAFNLMGNAADNTLLGNAQANLLSGGAGNDTLTGGLGNDTLTGGEGDDLYRFVRGAMGSDTLTADDGDDELAFFDGSTALDAGQLWFRHVANDLEISIIGTTDKVTVKDWYSGNHIERISLNNQQVLLEGDVEALVSAMSTFKPAAVGQVNLSAAQHTALDAVIAVSWQALG